ncbi:MAG: NAD(P)H-hydrate dehydratase [Chlorobiaceae bacterium]|nr:NAD(P)H-hydrate dehydratase [Chlorobiaceae bacterium]
MLPVLTAKEMKRADKAAIEQLHIGETRLMELAGRECLRIIKETLHKDFLQGTSFLVVAGKGNNGGDGLVLARHLLNLEASVDLVLLYPEATLQGVNRECLATLQAYRKYTANLRIFASHDEAIPYVGETSYDILIDAITGTGLRLTEQDMVLSSPLAEGIELINTVRERTGALTLAIDVPTGLDATTGFAATPSIAADITVTMAFLKTGFYLNEGPYCCGEVRIAEISIPGFLAEPSSALLTDKEFAAEHFTLREPSSAKHANGKVLIIAGSQTEHSSMLGAAILSAKAALKTGAGYVCVSVPISLAAAIHTALPEAVVIGRDTSAILEKAVWADAIVIGCGLGRDTEVIHFFTQLLSRSEIHDKKLVLDADALYSLSDAGTAGMLKNCKQAVLTPHYGEFSRLSGASVEDIAADPIEAAKSYARHNGISLLLKGTPTVIAKPEGAVLLNTSGTEALATAGSGDVLSGVIAALAAKGADIFNAAAAGAWFHGRAGDLAGDVASLVSSGMVVDTLQQAFQEVFEIEEHP